MQPDRLHPKKVQLIIPVTDIPEPPPIEMPAPKQVVHVAPENRELYKDMLEKLDCFSNACAYAVIPFRGDVKDWLLTTGITPLASYKCTNVFMSEKGSDREVDIKQVLNEGNLESKYGLVTVSDAGEVEFRGFANRDILQKVEHDIHTVGYAPYQMDTNVLTYMRFRGHKRFRDIDLLLNESAIRPLGSVDGLIEAAILMPTPDAIHHLTEFVTALPCYNVSSDRSRKTGSRRVTAELAGTRPMFFPSQVKILMPPEEQPRIQDLSIPESYGQMLKILQSGKER
jgi:hypothetical protein